MIILTGGAGFIGSCFLWKLNQEGIDDIIIVDDLGKSKKWKNLIDKKFKDYIQKDDFLKLIEHNKFKNVEYIIHMGACSSTILNDAAYYIKNNYKYSKILATWAFNKNVSFMYASSAATYGDGRFGFSDDKEITYKLQPLNLYGYSKHLFDLWILSNNFENRVIGFKFFNVFGPNEYHKGEMKSVICKKFSEVKNEGCMKLFKSYHDDYNDGEQKRDFIYIKDVIEIMYWFFKRPNKTGIFNLGTGQAHSWNELAHAMFKSLNKELNIIYIDMPNKLKDKYQYFTQADISKLKRTGCDYEFMQLEDAVKDYISYLKRNEYL